jgi:hypothetical protein
MSAKLYYTVALEWDGRVTVGSFGGRNAAEERRFAATCRREVFAVTTDFDQAQALRARIDVHRQASPDWRRQLGLPAPSGPA